MLVSQSSTSSVYATSATQKTSKVSAYDTSSTQSTQQTDRLAQMQEKYKDIYTPIPETYSQADEDLQTQKIYEAYPNYVSFTEIFKKMCTLSDGSLRQLGQIVSPEEENELKQQADAIFAEFGGRDSYKKMEENVYAIKEKYPINQWTKDGMENAKELARFENAVVYEALESGKTLEEAKKYAGSIRETFISMNAKEGMPNAYKPDFSSTINSVWNLGQYGIEGDWTKNSIYNNDKAMISELEKKINQFNFMLNNEQIIKQADNKLDPSEQNLAQVNYYQDWINEKYLSDTQFALKIFQNYNIYDSIDTKA